MIKPSPISEGVTDIWINLQPCKGKTWQHNTCQSKRHHQWQQFAMWSKSHAGSYLTLVHIFHVMPSKRLEESTVQPPPPPFLAYQLSVFSAPAINRVYKIAYFQFWVALANKNIRIYPGLGLSCRGNSPTSSGLIVVRGTCFPNRSPLQGAGPYLDLFRL
jgi:hypothetical protein